MASNLVNAPHLSRLNPRKTLNQGGLVLIALTATIIYIFPLFWMVSTSLKAPADILRDPPIIFPSKPDIAIYREIFGEPPATAQVPIDGLLYMKNSLLLGLGTMTLTMALAVPTAYTLARFRLKGNKPFMILLLLTQMLPEVLLVIPLFIFFRDLTLINKHLSVILADTAMALPFSVIILRTSFLQVPRDLEEAALIDGASRLRALWKVIVPLVRPGLIAVTLFSFLYGWGDFVFSLSFLQEKELHPLALGIYNFVGYYRTRWEGVMAFSTIIALPVVITILALQRYYVTGLTAGSVK